MRVTVTIRADDYVRDDPTSIVLEVDGWEIPGWGERFGPLVSFYRDVETTDGRYGIRTNRLFVASFPHHKIESIITEGVEVEETTDA